MYHIAVVCGKSVHIFASSVCVGEIPEEIFCLVSETASQRQSFGIFELGILELLVRIAEISQTASQSPVADIELGAGAQSVAATESLRTLTVSEDTILTAFFASNQDIDAAENEDFRFITHGERIVIEGAAGERVFVSDVLGRIVFNATVNEKAEIAVRNRGVFFVKVGNRPARKIIVMQ